MKTIDLKTANRLIETAFKIARAHGHLPITCCVVEGFLSELARQISQPMMPMTATAMTSIRRTREPLFDGRSTGPS